ncbi:hypothetical protein ACFQL8_09155 [Streptomyces goshikiensis]|uniref:hypothetical protein n=1 Tax=Streptomyces goshikiensis TaxID=1942 RepID=UPI0016766B55|nr:hypothetical protein [Streptomyces goshikiensis]GHD82265.1 hypothetical protein GCM10010336_69440 [Streptomyces goshikiensis]
MRSAAFHAAPVEAVGEFKKGAQAGDVDEPHVPHVAGHQGDAIVEGGLRLVEGGSGAGVELTGRGEVSGRPVAPHHQAEVHTVSPRHDRLA